MITKISKIIISKIYNLDSINSVIDLYIDQDFLLILSKDLVVHILNKNNNQVYSFKVIIFEKEEDVFFEFVKIVNLKKIKENLFEANLLIKNFIKGIYLLNVYLKLIDNEYDLLLNNFDYLDFKFLYFINNDLLNQDYNINNPIILTDKGIYDINAKNFIYKEEDILKANYLELNNVTCSFLIDNRIFFITKKGFLFIFEINNNKELEFINSIFLDNFYHKNLMNIRYFFVKNKIFIFLDNWIYIINNLDNLNETSIGKCSFFELSKDFYEINSDLFEKLNGILFYKNNYYLIIDNYLVFFDVDNLKFNKIKDFGFKDYFVKLKIINNFEILVIFEKSIVNFKNIFENTLSNEIVLKFNQKLLLTEIDESKNQDMFENNISFEELNKILVKDDNVNNIFSFNLISVNKYNEFYFIFFDIPIFAILDNKNIYFYPVLFNSSDFDYKKTKIISNIGNLIFFKFNDSYYYEEFELSLEEDYPKCLVKDIKTIYIKEENILRKPILFVDNKVFFYYQNKIYFLNLNKNNLENNNENDLKLINLNDSYSISDVNYFDNNLIYSFYIDNDDIILKKYEINSFDLSLNLVNEVVFKNVSDFYRNLLINSNILDFKLFDNIFDNKKFYLKILRGNIIYHFEISFDNLGTKIKLVNNFDLNLDNILNVFKVNNDVFIYSINKLYYLNLETYYLNFVNLFKVNKKLKHNLDLFLVSNLIILGKIEDFNEWEKIIFVCVNEYILDILFYEDKLILILESFIAVDIPSKLITLDKPNFIELLKLNNIIYLKRYFNNKLIKSDKLFLLDEIGNFRVFDIKTGDLFKTYLGYLNEGKIKLINNNIYIITKESWAILIE
jgi:hypothetical protein